MQDPHIIARIKRKFQLLAPEMDERRRRQWAAAEARDLGWGGISLVARATGLSRPTIHAGLRELDQPSEKRTLEGARIRRLGGGRKSLVSHQAIVNLIASTTTRAGLTIKAALDSSHYETKIKITDEELSRLHLKRDEFHGDWNYTLSPRRRGKL